MENRFGQVSRIFETPTVPVGAVTPVQRRIKVAGKFGWHYVAFIEWQKLVNGFPSFKHTAVTVHGLTRSARDSDAITSTLSFKAQYLAYHYDYRVVCIDVIGRGESDRLVPSEYGYERYVGDIASVITFLNVPTVDYIGTSMGGLAAMFMMTKNHPFRKVILVDVAPFVPLTALQMIATYAGIEQVFSSLDEAEAYFKAICGSELTFGSDGKEIAHMAYHNTRWVEKEGVKKLTLHYDLGIKDNFAHPSELGFFSSQTLSGDLDLWVVWEHLSPTDILLIRGENSTLVSAETAERMRTSGPRCRVTVLPRCGHAPLLMSLEQMQLVAKFFTSE